MKMTRTRQSQTLGRKTVAAFAAALLAVTSVPAAALAQEASVDESMEPGLAYELPVEFLEADGSGEESPVAEYFAETADVVVDEDGFYDVTLALEDAEDAVEIEVEDHETVLSEDGATYTICDLESISEDIEVLATVPSLGEEAVSTLLALDLASSEADDSDDALQSLSTESSEATATTESSDEGSGSASTLSTSSASFEVGHTYSVPMELLKETGTDTSMADQYFGDEAYVRPLSDGNMEVSFTTNRLDYISGITYNGSSLPLDGSTFTLTTTLSTDDVVTLPIGLTVVPMVELGMGEVTANLTLYMSQATDLGTDVESNPDGGTAPATDPYSDDSSSDDATASSDSSGSSSSSLAKTNDQSMVAVGIAIAFAAAGAAAIGGLIHSRRRIGE